MDTPSPSGPPSSGLPSRDLFNLPRAVSYLNAGAYGPLSRVTLDAGAQALSMRAEAWRLDKGAVQRNVDTVRALAGGLIGAEARDMAVVTSISQAAAVAAAALPAPKGARVVMLAGEHPSNALPWRTMFQHGCVPEVVAEPLDGDWTRAVLEAIGRPGAPPVAAAALSPYRWTDGARLDLDQVVPAVRKAGGAIFLDATHLVGAVPVDISAHRPDFLAFPLFKWLMGPYGYALLYADPARQDGEPADPSATNSRLSPDLGWAGYVEGARRYDRGERDDPVSMAVAVSALEQISAWKVERYADKVKQLGDRLAHGLAEAGATIIASEDRAPHIIGARLVGDRPVGQVVQQLAARDVHVSERMGVIRITPHLYNDAEDVDQLLTALRLLE